MSSPESPVPTNESPGGAPAPEQGSPAPKPKQPAWIAGAVLILVGLVFLLQNVAGFTLDNWWALFILIPAVGSLWTAWSVYRKNGRKFTAAARGPLTGGIVLLTVAAFFLFNVNWGTAWPVFLIIAGAAVLVGVIVR